MISCKIATKLISKSLDENLTLAEELKLKMHLFLCETCHLFGKQSRLLRKLVQRSKEVSDESNSLPNFSAEAKIKLKKILDETADEEQSEG